MGNENQTKLLPHSSLRRRQYRRPLLVTASAANLPPYQHQIASAPANISPQPIVINNESKVMVRKPKGIPNIVGGLAISAVKLVAVLAARIFCSKAWPFMQTATLSTLFIKKQSCDVKVSKAANILLEPLRWFSGCVLWTTVTQHALRWCWPDAYRTLQFWRRLLPIYTGYMHTKWQVRKKCIEDRHKAWGQRHEWGGERVYQLIVDMSGFYVKSAQILASKAEFVPEAWTKHLSKLLDSAPPRPFNEVEQTIQKELGKSSWALSKPYKKGTVPLDAVFLNLEKVPLAAASIAQVHGGVLLNGTRVAVKVQHKGMEFLMRSDLRNIVWLAKFLQGQLPVDIFPIVKEIQSTIPLEFDFQREVWFMVTISNSLESKGFKKIVCPSPYVELCTKRLIVMQRIDGIPFSDILKNVPHLSTQAVFYLLEAYGQMIFADGVIHADPHAGNLFLLSDGRLGLLDYGQSKTIDKALRQKLSKMILALCSGNEISIALALLDIGVVFEPVQVQNVSLSTVATAARILFDVCFVEEATVSPMSQNSILKEMPLKKMNQSSWMVIRTILLLRGLCYSLNINISAAEIWRPYATKALNETE